VPLVQLRHRVTSPEIPQPQMNADERRYQKKVVLSIDNPMALLRVFLGVLSASAVGET
jgi:hypothetical protein